MNPRGVVAAVLMGMAVVAYAQQPSPVRESYSLEIGTGVQPLVMGMYSWYDVERTLAEKGQEVGLDGAVYPLISLTGVIRSGWKTEFTMTGGICWCHHRIIQYSVFGTDPAGKPRYNLKDGTPVGWADSHPVFTLTWQGRHIWNPRNAFQLYSALGFGVTSVTSVLPIPSITPIAARYGGEHLYGFFECTLGPIASFAHGGLGWRF